MRLQSGADRGQSELSTMMLGNDSSGRSFGEALRHAFRERELYIRSDTGLRYITIRSWVSVSAAVIATIAIGWTAFATSNYLYKKSAIWAANEQTQSVRAAYEDRIASMQETIDRASDQLMLDQDGYMGGVHTLRGEFAELLRRHHRLVVFFEQGWLPVQSEEDPEAEPAVDGDRTPEPQREGAVRRPETPRFATVDEARRPLHEVSILFSDLIAQQHSLLDQIIEMSERKAEELRTATRRLGLDPATVVAGIESVPGALGGPLLPVQESGEAGDALDERILEAHRRFSEAEKLLYAFSRMPIRLPLARGYRLSSGFGFRRDPFKNVVAMHAGVDLRAELGTPVRATAEGRVVRAEHADAYGKVIDVKHDNGITSRYAHLNQINVAVGDRVSIDQIIGLVGSTGRSTGAHLHYETHVEGRPIDPYQFLRVAQDVLREEAEQ